MMAATTLANTMTDSVVSAFHAPAEDIIDPEAASVHSASTTLSDLLDIEVDPPLLFASITSLLSTLEDTVVVLGTLRQHSSDSLLGRLSSVCHDLFKQLCELEQLVSSYLHVWNPNEPDDMVVLDPMAYKWVADCMICLLGLHAHLREELGQYEISKVLIRASFTETTASAVDEADMNGLFEALNGFPDRSAVATSKTYLNKIQSYSNRLQSALPLMQADLSTYQTSNLQFPGDVKSKPSPPNVGESSSSFSEPQQLTVNIPLLRRTLYGLKDALSELDVAIKNWLTENVISKSSATRLHSLQISVSFIMNALSRCLTNHGSDWLDSLLAGGMSFSHFRALNRERLQTVDELLRKWTQCVRIRVVSSGSSSGWRGKISSQELELTEEDVALPKRLLGELDQSLKAEFCS